MKLIPFSPQYLRPAEALPFGVRDESGRLLLAAGQKIDNAEQLAHLRSQPLFAEETESAEWRRRLAAAMDSMIRRNATLKQVASVRPELAPRESVEVAGESLAEQWDGLVLQLDAALRDLRPEADGLARVQAVHERARALAARRFDASLYHLVYAAGHSTERYSAHHALLSMLICEHAAPLLQWPERATGSIGLAALTMNVAMARLQDQLAATALPPTPEMRQRIDRHAAEGAALLRGAGCTDTLACRVVELHHDAGEPERALAELPPEGQLARLLRRVDIFGAKMSRRRTRSPMSPVQAAREACLGANGQPDEIGSALLKTVGLYPPGSFVELASGEVGIVVARGRRANLPVVASLVSAAGTPLGEPALRDTVEPRHSVRAAVPVGQVKVRPPHERVLALR